MKQWDINLYPFPGAGPHPAVILTPDLLCADSRVELINGLICTSLKPRCQPHPNEAMLKGADGLEWETIVRCDLFHSLLKSKAGRLIGSVSLEQRRAISRAIIESFKLRAW